MTILESNENATTFFLLFIKFTNKINKFLVDVMEKISAMQLDIHNCNFKEHMQYPKTKYKKVHKMNKNLVTILSNFSTTMCHAFITNRATHMPPLSTILDSSYE